MSLCSSFSRIGAMLAPYIAQVCELCYVRSSNAFIIIMISWNLYHNNHTMLMFVLSLLPLVVPQYEIIYMIIS